MLRVTPRYADFTDDNYNRIGAPFIADGTAISFNSPGAVVGDNTRRSWPCSHAKFRGWRRVRNEIPVIHDDPTDVHNDCTTIVLLFARANAGIRTRGRVFPQPRLLLLLLQKYRDKQTRGSICIPSVMLLRAVLIIGCAELASHCVRFVNNVIPLSRLLALYFHLAETHTIVVHLLFRAYF